MRIPKTLFFDTETTGLLRGKGSGNRPDPHLVQLGALLVVGDGAAARDSALFHCLIKPIAPDGSVWTIPEEATKIHGITTEMCERGGIELVDALAIFHEMADIANCIVAHNYEFDSCLIDIELRRLGQQAFLYQDGRQFCTMKASTQIVNAKGENSRGSFTKYPKLKEAHQHFLGVPFDGEHTAVGDVQACRSVYFALMAKLAELREATMAEAMG